MNSLRVANAGYMTQIQTKMPKDAVQKTKTGTETETETQVTHMIQRVVPLIEDDQVPFCDQPWASIRIRSAEVHIMPRELFKSKTKGKTLQKRQRISL
jgi:hypothetical protein